VFSPRYDSPGARVPIVVTLYDGPATLPGAALDATATGGARVEECGVSWRNPQTNGLSRTCHLVLPAQRGTFQLTGRAVWRTPAGERQAVTSPALDVEAKGPASAAVDAARAEAIAGCGNTGEDVWLTFDDVVPSFEVAEGMVAVLTRNGVRGRFFLNRVEPRVRRLLESRGHVVTNHTRDHLALTDLSRAAIAEQIRTGPATTPGSARLLRPPFGAGAWSTRVVDAIDDAGHTTCRWTVDTRDWAGRTPEQMAATVRWGDESSPPTFAGGVVLMHATAFAPAKLQAVIDAVAARGLVIEAIPTAGWASRLVGNLTDRQ